MEERKFHINVLELKAAKLAIMSFTLKERDATISVHIPMDNMTALSYLMKMGGGGGGEYQKPGVDCNQQGNLAILVEAKDNDYCRILTRFNELRGRQGIQGNQGSTEWQLNPTIFMKLCQIRETPEVDLFASRVSHQLPHSISWKIDPFSQAGMLFGYRGLTSLCMLFPLLHS